MKIIITDQRGRCWKLRFTEDMDLTEIVHCIESQFYRQDIFECVKTGKGVSNG